MPSPIFFFFLKRESHYSIVIPGCQSVFIVTQTLGAVLWRHYSGSWTLTWRPGSNVWCGISTTVDAFNHDFWVYMFNNVLSSAVLSIYAVTAIHPPCLKQSYFFVFVFVSNKKNPCWPCTKFQVNIFKWLGFFCCCCCCLFWGVVNVRHILTHYCEYMQCPT